MNANPVSDNHAVNGARMVLSTLPALMRNLGDIELRRRMALAALTAGLAFSNTRTALAHSISYDMTIHHGLPHGIACSFTLGMVLQRGGRERAGDERSAALPCDHQALALEVAIRLRDRVRVDREIRDDLSHRRQLVTDVERSEPERVLHLSHDLQIGRDAGLLVEVELDHRRIVSPSFAGGKTANPPVPYDNGTR